MKLEDYILLIYKDLKGEISKEEKKALEAHKSMDSEAKKIYKEVETAWQGELLSDHDIENDLTSLHKKMEGKEAKSYRLWPRILRIAAIFLLITTVTLVIYQRNNTFQNRIFASEDMVVELPDGSFVQIMKGSSISHKKNFLKERTLELSGKAYFEVLPNEISPFIVSTSKAKVTVLGTQFTVDNSGRNFVVSVREGRVSFGNENDELILEENEVGILDPSKNISKENLDAENFNFWNTDQFRFQNEELKDILRQIALIFDVNINLQNTDMQNCKVSAVINGDEVDIILKAISEKLELEIKEETLGSFTLANGQCN